MYRTFRKLLLFTIFALPIQIFSDAEIGTWNIKFGTPNTNERTTGISVVYNNAILATGLTNITESSTALLL